MHCPATYPSAALLLQSCAHLTRPPKHTTTHLCRYALPHLVAFETVFKRELIVYKREFLIFTIRTIQAIVLGLITGSTFYNLPKPAKDFSHLTSPAQGEDL